MEIVCFFEMGWFSDLVAVGKLSILGLWRMEREPSSAAIGWSMRQAGNPAKQQAGCIAVVVVMVVFLCIATRYSTSPMFAGLLR
jgi:hypothetical protein